jgi:hypothetical protein
VLQQTGGALNAMSVTTIVGLLLGSVLLLGALFAHLKRQTFGLGGVVLVVFGSFLIGLSAFTSFEFSVGPVTGKYIQEAKEDLGVKTADLNGSIEQLKVKLAELTQDVAAIKRVTPGAAPTQEQVSKRESMERVFEQNSDYSVLVFHKPGQRETATQISRALLSVGFRSSATPTELKEATQQFKPNQAWIVYTSKGQEKLATLREVLASTGNKIEYIYRDSPYPLRSGDIQVLLF